MQDGGEWMRRFEILRTVAALSAVMLLGLGASGAVESELSVPEHGVGSAVVERELQGRAEKFDEGSDVWFWTLVVGAGSGDGVLHVWMQDGEERASVELGVDGSPWRTFSKKTLHPGSVGNWTVEARSTEGHVLARQSFACESSPVSPAPAGTPEAD
jgi:hypothetical protein